MNILDENILADQRQLLTNWRVPFRQVGYEVGRSGMKDAGIIPFLLTLRHPTFFTSDSDFYGRYLCHGRYAIVYLDVQDSEAASFVRRVLCHPEFDTHAKRMGAVIRASHSGLAVWRVHAEQEAQFGWDD